MFQQKFSNFSVGSQSDSDFSDIPNTLTKNRYIISRISKFAALTNKQFFLDNIKKRFKRWNCEENLEYLHVAKSEIIDEFGRCTFFSVKIGPHEVPLLQPGSFMFASGVESGAKIVTHHDGCQQNGPIMGMGCASFLAKVLTELTKEYQMQCIANKKNINNFCPKSYAQSVKKVLKIYSKEDAMEHGRFLELKSYLKKIGEMENADLDESSLDTLYYLKDISVMQGKEVEEFDLDELNVDPEMIQQIKNMRKSQSKYQDIEQYFDDESQKKHAMHVDFRNTIKFFIFAKRGIWSNHDVALMQLDFVFDGIEKTLDNDPSFCQIDDDMDKNTQQTKDEGQKDITYGTEIQTSQIQTESDTQETEESKDQQQIDDQYDICINEKLYEYYSQLKRGLDAKMRGALIADADIFQIKSSDTAEFLLTISDIIPDIGLIFKAAGLILSKLQEDELKDKLDKLASIYSNFEDLPCVLARQITLLKRNFIMELDEHFIKDYFDPKFVSHVNKIKKQQKVTLPQALAIKDTKIIESCCIALVHKQEIIPHKESTSQSVANKIKRYYKGFQINNQLSPPIESGEKPQPFERVIGFIIPDELFENSKVPKFLKRGIKDATPDDHQKRVKAYLQKLNQSQLFEILGEIDPTCARQAPLLELINEVNRGKQKSYCVIF